MPRNTQFLNQALCTVIIDGVLVEGLASGDSIKVSYNEEGSALEVGTEGQGVTAFSTDQSGEFEIDLFPTSPYLDIVNRNWLAQKTGAARLLTGQVLTSAAEPIRMDGMSISSPGNPTTGGKGVTPRTVKFKVQQITPQE